jgi:hypothetical protein
MTCRITVSPRRLATVLAVALCCGSFQTSHADIITLRFCGLFPDGMGGVLEGSFLKFDQSLINDAGSNFGLVDANIQTRRTDLAPFPSDLTYTLGDFSGTVGPTTSITSNVSGGPVTRVLPESVKGWSFLSPGNGEFFAIFPEVWLTTVTFGDNLSNDLITEFRSDGSVKMDDDDITAVPEPSGIALIALTILAGAIWHRRLQTSAT